MCATPQRFCDEVASERGAISSVPDFHLLIVMQLKYEIVFSAYAHQKIINLITHDVLKPVKPSSVDHFQVIIYWI